MYNLLHQKRLEKKIAETEEGVERDKLIEELKRVDDLIRERQGIEIDIDYKISDRYASNISYANITDDDGDHVRKIPKNKLTYTLNSKISEKFLSDDFETIE